MTPDKNGAIAKLLGDREVIAYRPALARLLGSVTAALFLGQAVYWQKIVGEGVWWYKLRDAQRDARKKMLPPTEKHKQSWEWEIGLTRSQQENARALLREFGLLEERCAGIPARLHYRINLNSLDNFLTKLVESRQNDGEIQPCSRQDTADLTDHSNHQDGKKQPCNTENKQQLSKINNNSEGNRSGSLSEEVHTIDLKEKPTHSLPEKHDILKIKESKTFKRLVFHGIAEELATRWILFNEKRITDILDYVEERIHKNLLHNSSSGYIRALFENRNASVGKSKFVMNNEAEKQKKKQAEKKFIEDTKNAQATAQEAADRVRRSIRTLTLEQRQQHAENYIESNGGAYKSYESQTGIFKDARDRIMFTAWLQTKITLGHLE